MDEEKVGKALNLLTQARYAHIAANKEHDLSSAKNFRQALIIALEFDTLAAQPHLSMEELRIIDEEAVRFSKDYIKKIKKMDLQ